ncbi:MAG: anthranilate phosphoribosyltransferase [Polyangiaceae bacterium]
MSLREAVEVVCSGRDLDAAAARGAFGEIARGGAPEALIAGLLVALKAKGETPEELSGAVEAYREAAVAFERPDYRFADSCGTGGDGHGTINVSTAAAFVAASSGLPIAKHGNRSVSSRSGSADVLSALGAAIEVSPQASRRVLDETGVCFLFAPRYHPGARHAAGVRRALGMRTIMNLLGPLSNPARPPVQLTGVYSAELVVPVARTLALLGCERALVVHGGGLDEIALHAPTTAALVRDGEVEPMTLTPEDAGVAHAPLSALAGGSPEENAVLLSEVLRGQGAEAHAAAIAINAGALLWIAELAPDLREGTAMAMDAMRSGRAHRTMTEYVKCSQREVRCA